MLRIVARLSRRALTIGFPKESEKFCTLDDISLLNKHSRALSKNAGLMRVQVKRL